MLNKELIQYEANKIGIEKIGFTNILDYSYLSKQLRDREKIGYSCELEEKDINKRIFINDTFPNCSSIITAAFPYGFNFQRKALNYHGQLSVSTFGIDYHKVINEKLSKLVEKLKKYINFNYKICVDTAPFIDREICKNSNLGYYGKNHMLINDDYGSLMFLGYILLDQKIGDMKSNNKVDICGECNLCIKHCPNKAIKDNGYMDSSRCISYLTQTKKYIPLEYREKMGNAIYGCDICQLVCPKNKSILETEHGYDYSTLIIDLEEIMSITNKEFIHKYGNMAGSWRGKNIWKRNSFISAANLHFKKVLPKIIDNLDSKSNMIKTYASWALIKLNKKIGKDLINNKIKYENEKIKEEYKKLLERT